MAKQKFGGLGRGLDAFFPGASDVTSAQSAAQTERGGASIVPIESIIPNPRQPRRVFPENDPRLLELSASIKEHGIIQPIVVARLNSDQVEETPESTPLSAGDDDWFSAAPSPRAEKAPESSSPSPALYQIIAGERRWRAATLAGLHEVPIVIKEVTPQQMLEMALIENIQRADLNPIEEALAYQALLQEFSLTQEMVAKQVGKDRSTITNSLRLLQLPAQIREKLMNEVEGFTEGHARALLGISGEEDQIRAMNRIIALRLTVRQAEEMAKRLRAAEDVEAAIEQVAPIYRLPSEFKDWEKDLHRALQVKVDLKCNEHGKGTLVLHFNNQDELGGLYNRLVNQDE